MGCECAKGSPICSARFWDAETDKNRFVKNLKHDHEAMTLAFGSGSKLVATNLGNRVGRGRFETLHQDATARLWNVDTRDKRLVHALEHEGDVSAASFSPDGRRLLTVSGTAVRLWDWKTGAPLIDLNHAKAVTAASFAQDGRLVVSSSSDGTARVWDVETGRERFVAKHQDEVKHALLVASGKLLATLSSPGLRLWSVSSGTAEIGEALFELADYSANLDGTISGDTISPDGGLVAARSGNTAQVWDVEQRKPLFELKHDGWVRTASFIAGGRSLVTGADELVARVWDTRSGEAKFSFAHAAQLHRVAVSPDGRTVLTAADDGTARLWDSESGQERFKLRHGCGLRDAWFAADGTIAVTRSDDDGFRAECGSKVMLWNAATGQERSTMAVVEAASTELSRDGQRMFSVHHRWGRGEEWQGVESLVRVWDADTGEERFAEPFPSDGSVRTATFSRDGSLLVMASGNRALIWAVAGELLQSAVAAATTVCLQPEFRRQNLGESDAEARRKYEACERKHGRE